MTYSPRCVAADESVMSRRFIGRALFGAGALAALSSPSPFGLGLATTLAIVGSLVIHLADQQDAPIPLRVPVSTSRANEPAN